MASKCLAFFRQCIFSLSRPRKFIVQHFLENLVVRPIKSAHFIESLIGNDCVFSPLVTWETDRFAFYPFAEEVFPVTEHEVVSFYERR